jgi:hypothetical protein
MVSVVLVTPRAWSARRHSAAPAVGRVVAAGNALSLVYHAVDALRAAAPGKRPQQPKRNGEQRNLNDSTGLDAVLGLLQRLSASLTVKAANNWIGP